MAQETTKQCPKCGVTHEPRPARLKVHDYQCKPCERLYLAARKAAGVLWRLSPAAAQRALIRHKNRHRTETYKAWRCAWVKLPHVAQRLRANTKLRYAVNTGKVTRGPCVVCSTPNGEGHHEDYSKPLDVIWLCKPHHIAYHLGRISLPTTK